MSVLESIMLKRRVVFSSQVYFAASDISSCVSESAICAVYCLTCVSMCFWPFFIFLISIVLFVRF